MTSWFFWTTCRGKRWAVTEFKKGDRVRWSSHGGEAVGTVERKITSDTEAGGRTVRASKDEPQYLVRSEKSGGTAVHKPSALRRA
jgi:hypothetical protein